MTRFERDKRAAIEAVVELLERIDKATVNMENAREEKDLVTFVYWFVLIHEYYYMLCEKPVPQRIAGSIYAEIESCSPIDYLKNKRKQCYERLPDLWFYGRGYGLEDIIGCAIYNRYDEELFTFSPDIRKMMCEGNLSRQNLMLHFLRKGENHEYVDFCDVCGKNLNDQPYPYAYRCTKCGRLFNLCTKCSNESAPKYWGNVGIMPKYDRYDNIVLNRLYNIECKTSQKEIDKLFTDKDVVQLPNGEKVKTWKIVHLVKDALELLKEGMSYGGRRYISKWLILYTCDNSITRTFAFDTNSNIYINVGFIHAVLKMDVELVYAMLFQIYHHDIYKHFKRQNEMLNDEGITSLTVGMHHQCNMAMEVEANRDLMRCLIVPKETWIDGIGGLFLQMKSDDYSTGQVNDIGWRDIYKDPKGMELLRKQLDVEFTLSPAKIHRSSTFRSGYDYAWHRISTLCVNYGIEKTHEKLKPIIKHIRKELMAPDFTKLYKRWSTGTPRKEDMILNIHNDHSRGSKNIFTDLQLGLFHKIVKEVDDFYKHDSLDCDFCISGMEPKVPPIFLVPYKEYLERMKNRCNSPFVRKMRQKYEAELEELNKKEYNQEEYYKRLQKLEKKYSPWICSDYQCKEGCVRKWQTPLGWFDPKKYEICICLDRIIETYPDKVDTIAAKVLLHELGHALMYNPNHRSYETMFEYWAEEALANKIALKYLFAASKILKKPELYTDAKSMVAHQEDAYKFGLYAFENNALDWRILRDYKTNINECKGDLWVDAACEDTPVFFDIQKLFYDAFIAKSITTMARGKLRVVTHSQTIQEGSSAATFVKAIDAAIDIKGEEYVVNAANTIKSRGKALISTNASLFRSSQALKHNKKMFVDTDSNNSRKKDLLESLFEELALGWKVDIV